MKNTIQVLDRIHRHYWRAYDALCRDWAEHGFCELLDIQEDGDDIIIVKTEKGAWEYVY